MDPQSLILFFVLFFLSGFFSGSETALMSIPKHKIARFIQEKRRGAQALGWIKNRNEQLLITLLIGNNLVNTLTASYATVLATGLAANLGYEPAFVIGIATGILTLCVLIIGEIIPKIIGSRYADTIALSTARLYRILVIVLTPLSLPLHTIIKTFQTGGLHQIISQDDVVAYIDASFSSGGLDEKTYTMVKKSFDFSGISVEEIMTPRIKIDALERSLTVNQAISHALRYTHTRFPVFDKSIDAITHIVTLRELMNFAHEGKGETLLSSLSLNKAHKIPLSQPIPTLLNYLQCHRSQIAIVMDEFGGTAGLVTIEDIIEQVFGEIHDEIDHEKEPIKQIGDQCYLIQADVRRDKLLEFLGLDNATLHFPDDEDCIHDIAYETISYVITRALHRFPKTGETIVFEIHENDHPINFLSLTVKTCTATTIEEVIISRLDGSIDNKDKTMPNHTSHHTNTEIV